MSRARNLADLLDSNGDVVSGALDNVAGLPDAIDVNASAPADSVVIDSSGNVLVGTANIYPADNNVTGHSLTAVGQLQSSVSGYAAFIGNRKSSDGDIATFKKDGTTVGSIGSRSSGTALQIYTSSTGIDFAGDGILPMVGSTVTDNSRDIGSSSYRFKNLYLSGGVYLGGTGSANYLDDYETGTWTPVVEAYSGTDPTVSYSEQNGVYTKIGNQVIVGCSIAISSISGTTSGLLAIRGLPFSISSGEFAGSFTTESVTLNNTAIKAVSKLGTGLGILSAGNGGSWNWETCAIFTNGSYIRLSTTYQTS